MAPRSEHFHEATIMRGPSNRKLLGTVDDWLEGKVKDDGAEGLWRVHDKLYDLTTYINQHPGGKEWLKLTRGTDITEAFECHHITDKAEKILTKFYVRDAKTPRNSLITFHENGFFKTLKRKIVQRNLVPDRNPTLKTKLLADGLAASVFVTGLLGTIYGYKWAIASGLLLNMLCVCAHNFFHMKDNWRMYYFNLSLMSVTEWRVSHVLSHHLFPNTLLDLEISMFEPLFRFLPRENKKWRHLSFVFCPFVMTLMNHAQFLRRVGDVFIGKKLNFNREEPVLVSFFLFLYVFGGQGLWEAFVTWNLITATASFSFALIGLTAAHHHPDLYHDGDFLGSDKDFGLLQLAAVSNRYDVDGNFVKTMVMFGEHALHHIFPSVDHGRLPALKPVFEETCKEFKVKCNLTSSKNLFVGMFRQLIRNYRNTRLMILENS